MAPPRERELDLVLFGATGFVGRLVATYLAGAAPAGMRVALAGRSGARLASVRDGLGGAAADWPLVVADSADETALAAMCTSARVVVSTVGPYARHGLPLVRACAAAGTDYADLTGEVTFVRRSIDEVHAPAAASGARIVHACGFDSIPSDLPVLALAERARADGAGELTDTRYALVSARGGFSGGTVDSLRAQLDAVSADPALRRVVTDPYALSPDRATEPPEHADGPTRPRRDPETGEWSAPFVMASFNTRIVRRSNALSGWAYGRSFRYSEVVGFGSSRLAPVGAALLTGGTAAVVGALRVRPARRLVDRLLPAPGSGPSERTLRSGHFRVRTRATTTGGATYVAHLAADGDPGYTATATMLGESALSLALDPRSSDGGVLTPATALGAHLPDRLRAAGFELRVSLERQA